MTKHVRSGYITPHDLLLREATLLDYYSTWIEQVQSLLAVIRLNYATSFCMWSTWAALLGSLAHQIEARSLYLSATARTATKPMHARQMSYSCATAICLRLFEESYDSKTPHVQLAVRHRPQLRPTNGPQALQTPDRAPAQPPWPHEHANAQQDRIYQQGF